MKLPILDHFGPIKTAISHGSTQARSHLSRLKSLEDIQDELKDPSSKSL